MCDVVIYDPADPVVANRVTDYLKSVNTPDYEGNPNTLINPDLSGVSGVEQKYWKFSTPDVVEMSAGEKDAVDAAEVHYSVGIHVINLRPGDGIPNHDANFAPIETLTGANISRNIYTFDYSTPECFRHEFTVPCNIDPLGDVVFEFSWFGRVPPAVSENVVWEIESIAVAADENQDQALVSNGTVESAASTVADEITVETLEIPVATLDWEAEDSVVVRFSRDADNALDTFHTRADGDDDALLLGINIEIDTIS